MARVGNAGTARLCRRPTLPRIISSKPRPVGLVGRLVARRYQDLEIAIPYAGLSPRQSTAWHLVQARQPATGIIVTDVTAVLDCADAINDLPAVIEFKRYLGQAVKIAVWMRAHHERNLWFGEPDCSCRFHRIAG
jgi:hypothetical protein